MQVGTGGFTNNSPAQGPVAGIDTKLFKGEDDLLDQDYQTPGQSGQAKWRFSNVYPVQRVGLQDVDAMVDASKEYVKMVDESAYQRIRQVFNQVRLEQKMRENYDLKREKRLDDQERKHKEQDERMKYGKKGFNQYQKDSLRPGEVKRYDKMKKKWVSNKD
jgi:hypothetical protein